MTPTATVMLALSPLIAWRIYARVRRMVGRQTSRPVRHWIAVLLLPVLVAALAFTARHSPEAIGALLAGCAGGAALGVVGLRKTRFESGPAGHFYTPNAPLGIALSLLLVCRIVYRLYEIGSIAPGSAPPDLTRSPLTLLVFGLMAGYYTCYAAGLLRWRRALREGTAPA